MINEKLYCPPTGALPQLLPDYCRFFNGVVRTDLQTLGDDELNAWGWEGPFVPPVARQTIKDVEQISDELKDNYEYNEKDGVWYSKSYDYIPEKQKVVWFSKERRYIILLNEEDSSEYEILYKTNRIPLGDNLIVPNIPVFTPQPISSQPILELPPILWDEFKNYLISSVEFNQYIASLLNSFPIVATSFPIAILKMENGNDTSFKDLWSVLKNNNILPNNQLINKLKEIAIQCNLPAEFIQFMGE